MKNDNIHIIIPAAGMGRRMKSYGPKPLIKIGNSTIIKNQIGLLNSQFPNNTIVLVCGFKADVLMNETPNNILKVENELFEHTNVCRSIGIALRVLINASKVLLVYGDLVFNSHTLKSISLDQSSVVIANEGMGNEEIGCIIDKDNNLNHLMYDLPIKWGQIAFFVNEELEMLKQLCWDSKNNTKFGFEIINQIIENNGSFKCIQNKNIKITDIDSFKDIERAKDILL